MTTPEGSTDMAVDVGLTGSAQPWRHAAQAFAATVQQERRRRQMSTGALAEQCAISVSFVHDIERAYPVDQNMVLAVCRNLGLPVPELASSPVHTFALLIRQRREQARLPQYQLAALAGLASKTIKEVEQAARWPRAETCIALLSVTALQLEPKDIADFVSDPTRASRLAQSLRDSAGARLQASQELLPRSRGRPKRAALSNAASTTVPTSSPTRRLLFTFRVYTDGSMVFVPALKGGAT